MKNSQFVIFVVLTAVFLDQGFKIWIKLNMVLGQEYFIFGDWFRIRFAENEGMAFGFSFWGRSGKMILSLLRLSAIIFFIYLIRYLIRRQTARLFIFGISLILAGAIGNMLDNAFYGLVFSGSVHQTASLFPVGGGYGGFLAGSVVDMIYMPLFEGFLPEWLPFFGGRYFIFLSHIFNLADLFISLGVISSIWLLIFHPGIFELKGNSVHEPLLSETGLEDS